MRAALLALAVSLLPGCAQILGASDPVTPFPVSPKIAGHYLLAISTHGAVTDTLQYRVDLTVDDADARTVSLVFVPLDHASRAALPAMDTRSITLDNAETYDFSLDPFDLETPAPATAGDAVITFDAVLDGEFPILGASTTATTDGFCGTLTGNITQPTAGALSATTFAAVKLEADQLPPLPAKVSCADLGQ